MAYKQAPINFGVGTGSSPLNDNEENEPRKKPRKKSGTSREHTLADPDEYARSPRPNPDAHTPSAPPEEVPPQSPLPFKRWFKKWKENREHRRFLKSQRESKVRPRDKR